MTRYHHGFTIGKFMPLHTGHIFLIESAMTKCDQLTIVVCSQAGEPIPGAIRFDWVREQFPVADVIWLDQTLPRDETGVAFWDVWQTAIEKICVDRRFDVVFSSDSYGKRLADVWQTAHIEVDVGRHNYPVSATDIRTNPKRYESFIPDVVKPYYKDLLKLA